MNKNHISIMVVLVNGESEVVYHKLSFCIIKCMTFFEKVRVLIFAHLNKSNQIRVRSMFLEFLEIVEGGETPVKRICEGVF